MNVRTRITVSAAAAVLLCLGAGVSGAGDLKRWRLEQNNWQEGKDLLPEPVLKRVQSGQYWFDVQEVDPAKMHDNYSQAFWRASEANDGKFGVDEETCGLKDLKTGKMPDFYYGYPFPKIDPKEPMAACKMAWNFEAANAMIEGAGASFTLNGFDNSGEYKRIKLWLHYNYYVGRQQPIPNPENSRYVDMTNVTEPLDVDGVAGLNKRPNDWTSQDERWVYVPSTRRVRRVNAATRSDPVGGLDIFADDVTCYGGKIEYYKWKLVGEGTALAPLLSPEPLQQNWTSKTHAEIEIPYFKAAYESAGSKGAPWLVVENLVMVPRPVWIIEGQSSDPYYNFGKVVMYMDKELYRIWWKLVHNRAGEYFYNTACAYHFSTNADKSFSTVTPNMVIAVNDKVNRACLAGRYKSQFIERAFEDNYFTLRRLTRLGD